MIKKENEIKETKKPKRIILELTLVDAQHLERALHLHCMEKELLEYRDSIKIPVFPIFKKLRKKMGLADDTFSK